MNCLHFHRVLTTTVHTLLLWFFPVCRCREKKIASVPRYSLRSVMASGNKFLSCTFVDGFCVFHVWCYETLKYVSQIVALSTTALATASSCRKPASAGNLQRAFPLKFNLPYFLNELRSADRQFPRRPRVFWEFFSTRPLRILFRDSCQVCGFFT